MDKMKDEDKTYDREFFGETGDFDDWLKQHGIDKL